ncbi:MAG: DUF3048 domain-containing protein, partial [Clostridiales bacterium]|nr:DUF3048 domain-containing protein [Clostridiales bacterium]
MKKNIVFIILIITLSITGCSKENENNIVKEEVVEVNYTYELIKDMFYEKRLIIEQKIKEKAEMDSKIEIVNLFDNRKPFALMIDNHVKARPQSGLSSAKIIYEILAEGSITRYMLITDQDTKGDIGPIRSSRPYFLSFAMEYNSLY